MKDAYEAIKLRWQETVGRQSWKRKGEYSKQRKQTGKKVFAMKGSHKKNRSENLVEK